MNTVQEREITVDGEAIIVRILDLGQGDCMTVADAAELIGITGSGLRSLVSKHGLVASNGSDQNLADLKAAGILPFKTTVANLLPRETIKALVKIVNTPQAWAAYNQLWQEVEIAHTDSRLIHELLERVTRLEHGFDTLRTPATVKPVATPPPTLLDPTAWPQLTREQVAPISRALHERAIALGLKGRAAKVETYKMMAALKCTFLPKKLYRALTFHNISPSDIPAALKLIETWGLK